MNRVLFLLGIMGMLLVGMVAYSFVFQGKGRADCAELSSMKDRLLFEDVNLPSIGSMKAKVPFGEFVEWRDLVYCCIVDVYTACDHCFRSENKLGLLEVFTQDGQFLFDTHFPHYPKRNFLPMSHSVCRSFVWEYPDEALRFLMTSSALFSLIGGCEIDSK